MRLSALPLKMPCVMRTMICARPGSTVGSARHRRMLAPAEDWLRGPFSFEALPL